MTWTYPALMGMSVATAIVLGRRSQRSLGLRAWERLGIGLGAFCGAMIGAKLPFVLADWEGLVSGRAWFDNGKTIVFGLVGGYFGVEVAKRAMDIRIKTGDGFAVPVAAAVAIGRLACFSAGCCFGTVTTLPWGVDFGDGQPRHPTQLYEFAFHLSAAIGLAWLHRRGLLRGQLIKLYILSYLAYRFATEFIRPEPVLGLGLTGYQWAALGLIPVFALLWIQDRRLCLLRLLGEPREPGRLGLGMWETSEDRMSHSSSLFELYMARLREFYRQPARIFWVYGFPTLLVVMLGVAFRSRPMKYVVVDLVKNAASDQVKAKLDGQAAPSPISTRPVVVPNVVPAEEAARRLRSGKTPMVVEAVPMTSGRLAFTYKYDPTRPDAVAARAAFDDAMQRTLGRRDVFEPTDVREEAPGSRYIDRLIPGLIGVNTMGGGLWGIGFLLVQMRIAKLLKRYMATPMPRRNFLLAILGARLTFLVPDVAALLLLGVLAFRMPIRGSLALLALVEIVGGLAFAGIGLLVASRASTTETVSGLMNLVMIPMWLFSGVFFPSDQFPSAFQPFIQALPLTHLVDALRMVLLDGAGLVAVAPSLAILSAWAVVTFFLALRLFRWS